MQDREDWFAPLAEQDLDAAAEIERLSFSSPWSRTSFAEAIAQPNLCYFVGAHRKDGVLVGCAGMHIICGECYIDTVAVHPGWRGNGIGRGLLGALIRYAKAQNADFLTLEVRLSNEIAKRLYQAMGFEKAGVRRDFYENPKEDAVIYTRFLTAEEKGETEHENIGN